MVDIIKKEVDEIKDDIIAIRRHMHQYPEVGFDTKETEHYIRGLLETEQIEILPTGIGVLGLIRKEGVEDYVLLRADIDALSLQENTGLECTSKNDGKMHACGHDGHTAMLMGALKVINKHRDRLKSNVLLMFQPAEEGPNLGGARIMMKDYEEKGLLPKIKRAYALHLAPFIDTGKYGLKYGSSMASTDEFSIDIIGKGGHPSTPHQNVDAISVAAKFIQEIESFISKQIDPLDSAVFSVGILNGGTARNIVSERCNLQGTIRCLSEESRTKVLEGMETILKGLSTLSGGTYELDILHGLPVLVNNDGVMHYVEKVIDENFEPENKLILSKPLMGAEDFAYVVEKIPSAFIWIGTRNEKEDKIYSLHSPKFNMDENSLTYGAKILAMFAFEV